jgi:NAD(P)-dependent dehydrogenase (short-subunit alcohol dehydrogenase family)
LNRLAGKAALITGAGSGIGRATAELFAKEGAAVAVVGLPAEGLDVTVQTILEAGGQGLAITADVTVPSQVESAVRSAVDAFGRLDVMFNNAGVGHVAAIEETSDQVWAQSLAVNLTGVFLGCRYAIPVMRRQGGGSIINSASTAALTGLPGRSAYAASKGGVIAMTRVLAIECAPAKIRVNSLSPGATSTEMVRRLYRLEPDPDAAEREHARRQPIGRLSEPHEVAQAALFLASDESLTVTGINLVVDGGFSVPR